MKKLRKIVITILVVLMSLNVIVFAGVKIWQVSNPSNEVSFVLEHALASFNQIDLNNKVGKFKKMMGGRARGICHPSDDPYNVSLLDEANINWVRFDIPSQSPYEIDSTGKAIKDSNGNYKLKQSYINYKNRCKIYKDAGMKVMGITPYVDDMLNEVGDLDVFTKGGEFSENFENFVKEVSVFYANDLVGYVDCFQISNELTVEKWQGALTTEQVVYYQGELQMKAMHDITIANNIPIGFNMCGYTLYYYPKMLCDNYSDYFDYIALDLYLGCFESSYKTTIIYDLLLRHFYNLAKKPVMLNEFGYISSGIPMADSERESYLLNTYGEKFSTEQKIRDNIEEFLDKFDELANEPNGSPMTNEARRKIKEAPTKQEGLIAAGNYIFSDSERAHIYKALGDGYYLNKYEHTEVGQAAFYKETIKRLSNLNFVCGYFAYCYSDSEECYQCGQPGCPVETGWGIVKLKKGEATYNDNNVTKKPSFYALQEAYGRIKRQDRRFTK